MVGLRNKAIVYKVAGFGERTAGPYTEAEVEAQRTDIAGFEGVSDVRVIDVTFHLLVHGSALCGYPGTPMRWPRDHTGLEDPTGVTCRACLTDHRTLYLKR